MRGNLVYEQSIDDAYRVKFVEDANGEYEVVEGGRITQHQKNNAEEFERLKRLWEESNEFVNDARTKKKDKQVLFPSYDGVPIHEDDLIHGVYNDTLKYFTCNACYSDGMATNKKYFSTKETAEEYIALNKPMFSVNEIIEKTMPIKLSNRNDRLLIVSQLIQSAKEKMES